MFHPNGPTLRELTVEALSSTERGYDLLAPKFDHTPFRTPDIILDAVAAQLADAAPSPRASTCAAAPARACACCIRCAVTASSGWTSAGACWTSAGGGSANPDGGPAVEWVRGEAGTPAVDDGGERGDGPHRIGRRYRGG